MKPLLASLFLAVLTLSCASLGKPPGARALAEKEAAKFRPEQWDQAKAKRYQEKQKSEPVSAPDGEPEVGPGRRGPPLRPLPINAPAESFSTMAAYYPVTTDPKYGQNTQAVIHYTDSLPEWQYRAVAVQRGLIKGAEFWNSVDQVLADHSSTFWPLNPLITPQVITTDYVIYGVRFEASSAFYVTGNLYVPKNVTGAMPGVIVPHGHFGTWGGYVRTLEENQVLCAELARMGAVVFTYDMIGWGDSQQLDHPDSYGFLGVKDQDTFDDGTSNNLLALQLWDSLRSLDFLLTLTREQFPGLSSVSARGGAPETLVDPARVGVTGASGGATQSLYLSAIDPRIATASFVVMIAAGYTGDDWCEDGMAVHHVPWWPDNYAVKQLMRDSNNAEIAATLAPKPVLVISDGVDWTMYFPKDEYPYMKRAWDLFESPTCVHCSDRMINVHLANEQHDYGPSKRMATYQFFNIALKFPRFGAVASLTNNVMTFTPVNSGLVTSDNPEGVELQTTDILKVPPLNGDGFLHWCRTNYIGDITHCLNRPWNIIGQTH